MVDNFLNMKKLKTLLSFLLIFCAFNFQAQSKKTSFIVNGMCGMCKERIESTLDVKGVTLFLGLKKHTFAMLLLTAKRFRKKNFISY